MYSPLPTDAGEGAAGAAGVAPAGGGSAVLGGLALAAPPDTARVTIPAGVVIALAICLAFTIGFGVYPSPLIHFARHATLFF
jgi:hypothetical protein